MPKIKVKDQTRRSRVTVHRLDPSQQEYEVSVKSYLEQRSEPDVFAGKYATTAMTTKAPLAPPYNLNALTKLVDENFMLRQCIDAMSTNVHGHGYRWEFIGKDKKQSATPASEKEKEALDKFLSKPNPDQTLSEFTDAIGQDYEATGNAYAELNRDQKGRVVIAWHIPSASMRMTARDKDSVEVEMTIPRGNALVKQKVRKYFRRYVQLAGGKMVFFKEYGDPRTIDPATGEVNDKLPIEEAATEVFHFHRYNPRSPYGVPRWLPQLPAILGSRQAELTNLDYFSDNAIPAMAIVVQGGLLPENTLNEITDVFNNARGRDKQHKVVTIEVMGDPQAGAPNGQVPIPQVKFETFGDRQKDGLFLDYKKDCGDAIRSAFRLPPLFVGLSQDMTYATANTSFEVAESQVFAPERTRFDDFFNNVVLQSWEPQFWAFRSLPARISDPTDIPATVNSMSAAGGMTPNIAVQLCNEYFGTDVKEFDEEWGNWPFELVKIYAQAGTLKGVDALVDLAQKLPPAQPGDPNAPANPDGTPKDTNPKGKQVPAEDGNGNPPPVKGKQKAQRIIEVVQALDRLETLSRG